MSDRGRSLSFTAEAEENGSTVGDILRRHGVSRRLTAKLKRTENGITLNGKHIRTVDTVKAGDMISLLLLDEKTLEANSGLYAPVVYEDDDVVIFDKPVNMPVHPSAKHRDDTLGNLFSAEYPGLTFRPINRLDRDTSGLCAVAKNAHAANLLCGNINKVYYAAVCGKLTGSGIINAPIARERDSIVKRVVRPDGQPAVTEYTAIKCSGKYTLLRVILHTGRTHQIRVHFSHMGFPLAGDDLYGGSREDISAQALHCGELSFELNGRTIRAESPIREDIMRLFVTDL